MVNISAGSADAAALQRSDLAVLLVTCNGEAFVFEQVQSILRQSCRPSLLLVSDDASSDQTPAILQSLAEASARLGRDQSVEIKLLLWPDRIGVTANISRGLACLLEADKIRYVAFADQDDVWSPNKLEITLQAMLQSELVQGRLIPALVHTDLRLVDVLGNSLKPSYWRSQKLDPSRNAFDELLFQNVVTGCTTLVNRELLELALPIPASAVMHDSWLALVASAFGTIRCLPNATVAYRQHERNLVGSHSWLKRLLPAWESMRQGTAAERHLHPAIDQAAAFTERFSHNPDLHTSSALSTLQTLLALKGSSVWHRLKAALALPVRKQGFWRYCAFYTLLLWPRRRRLSRDSAAFEPYHLHVRVTPLADEAKPKVLHAIANVQTGGSTRLVVDLVERLSSDYRQLILTSYQPTPVDYVGLEVEEMSLRCCRGNLLPWLLDQRPDLVHVHYWGGCDKRWYAQVFAAAEQLNIPVIQNVNTPVAPFHSSAIRRSIYVSEAIKTQYGGRDCRGEVVYPGSDFSLFRPASSLHDSVRRGLVVGMVYRLEPDKLPLDAIDVFLEIVRIRPDCRCLIVGGGSLLEPFRARVCDAGYMEAFHFTDYVAYSALPSLYREMDVFVAPVWQESFGQVTPFAMASGVPVVGYRVGALPEIVNDQHLLANPGDWRQLAALASTLLGQSAWRKQVADLQRRRALDMFSVESMVNAYGSLYASLLPSEARRTRS